MFIKVLFFASTLLTIFSAISVVLTKNIMHACIYLLGSLIGVAGLFVTLGADFVAATQFMVYVGGVVILCLFAVMLTGGGEAENKSKVGLFLSPIMGSKTTYAFGIISAIVFLLTTVGLMGSVFEMSKNAVPNTGEFEVTAEKIGTLLLTDHILAFELASVLLLGALIGAAIIARPKVLKLGKGEN